VTNVYTIEDMIFIYPINTQEEVVALLKNAQQKSSDGDINWNSNGTSVSHVRNLPIQDFINECITYLRTYWPNEYGYKVSKTKIFRRS
jgi:hypothetical protein